MSLLLAALVLVATAILPAVVARDAISAQELDYRNATARLGQQFEWPDEDVVADPQRGYEVLAAAADKAQVNLVRMSTASRSADHPRIAYYVYLGRSDSALFDRFDLASGRWLTRADIDAGNAFVANTAEAASPIAAEGGVKVVGVPRVLGGAYDLSFAPMTQAYLSLPMAGTYAIDALSNADAQKFLTDIGGYLDSVLHKEIALATPGGPEVGGRAAAGNRYLPYLLIAVIVVLMVGAAARDGKRVGAMLLLGFPASRIWLVVAGRLHIAAVVVGVLACLVVLMRTPGADARFAGRIATPLAIAMCLSCVVTVAAATILVRRIRISDLVKGRVS